MADPPPDTGEDTGTPRWVKVSGAIAGAFVLLVIVMLLTGHDPSRHLRGGTPPAGVTLPEAGH